MPIQRCQIPEARNVESKMASTGHAELRRRLRAAWGITTHRDAKEALEAVVGWLRSVNGTAASSLEEALEDTLTVHRLGVTGALGAALATTNPIESAIDRARTFARRVNRWRGTAMVMRWSATGLLLAEGSFRRVQGYADLLVLLTALAAHDLCDAETAALAVLAGMPLLESHRRADDLRGSVLTGWLGMSPRRRSAGASHCTSPCSRVAAAPR